MNFFPKFYAPRRRLSGTIRVTSAFGSTINEAGQKKMYVDKSDSNPKSMIKGQIDENLKRIYDETLNEQIPDRLLALVRQLRAKLPKGSHSPATSDADQDPA